MYDYLLVATDEDGTPLYYTGRPIGRGWVSRHRAEAWPDTEANQRNNAERWNRGTGLHGLSFEVKRK